MSDPRLLFVYNADGGLFNTMTDIAHKILSPNTYSCNLCALTHGYFSAKDAWLQFLENTPVKCEFLHRDEFLQEHADMKVPLPAIFVREDQGMSLLIGAEDINACTDLEDLQGLIRQRLATRV